MSVEFDGFDKIIERFNNLADEAEIEKALGKACALVERSAKEKAPKDNGELRRSITSKVENNEGIVFTPLKYAPYIYVWSLNRAKSGKPKQLKYQTI